MGGKVIRGLSTGNAAFEAVQEPIPSCTSPMTCSRVVQDLTNGCGKTAVPCVDSPGFVCNRILVPMINEAPRREIGGGESSVLELGSLYLSLTLTLSTHP